MAFAPAGLHQSYLTKVKFLEPLPFTSDQCEAQVQVISNLIGNATSIAGIAIERKKAEENLRRSEWSLLEAQRLGRSGSWSLDVSSGIVTPSRKCSGHLTSNQVTTVRALTFGYNRIHPEDRKRVRDLFERCVMENTDYEADYRLLLPDGTIKYQHSIGRPIVNEKGRPRGICWDRNRSHRTSAGQD